MDSMSQPGDGMGTTPEQVAERLMRERVQGMRDSCSFLNPIVRYLNRNLDLGGKLEVGRAARSFGSNAVTR